MKTLLLMIALVSITACGKGGGGGSQGRTVEPIQVKCDSKIERNSLMDYAVSANKARTECNLSEDQTVQFVTL